MDILSQRYSLRQLLGALDGIAYVVAADGTVLGYHDEAWNGFAVANGAPELTVKENVIGRSLYDFIEGDIARESHRMAAEWVLSGARAAVRYYYRCDSPDVRRDMRLAISRIAGPRGAGALLYHSIVLREELRPPVGLFEPGLLRVNDTRLPIVTICTYCKAVALPPGSQDGEWVTAEEYYRRGCTEEVRLSHGVCPECDREIRQQWLQGPG